MRAEVELGAARRRRLRRSASAASACAACRRRRRPSAERAVSDCPSCCATHPATATIGSRPVSSRQHAQLAEARVQLVLRVLPHAARVDHDDVGLAVVRRTLVPAASSRPGHLLGVVIIHLAAVRFDQIFAAHMRPFALRLSLSPFDFASPFAPRTGLVLEPSISAALASTPADGSCPAIMRAISWRRSSASSRATDGGRAAAAHGLGDPEVHVAMRRRSAAGA